MAVLFLALAAVGDTGLTGSAQVTDFLAADIPREQAAKGIHPEFARYFTHLLYDDPTSEFAPFGNDDSRTWRIRSRTAIPR